MSEIPSQATPKVHPLQPAIERLAPIVGAIMAFFLTLLSPISVFLVISSAFKISDALGLVMLFGGAVCLLLLGYVLRLVRLSRITINEKVLSPFSPAYILLVICGFIQTIFWVIDPSSNIHEPRSVFMLAAAGAIAYFRYESEKALSSKSATMKDNQKG